MLQKKSLFGGLISDVNLYKIRFTPAAFLLMALPVRTFFFVWPPLCWWYHPVHFKNSQMLVDVFYFPLLRWVEQQEQDSPVAVHLRLEVETVFSNVCELIACSRYYAFYLNYLAMATLCRVSSRLFCHLPDLVDKRRPHITTPYLHLHVCASCQSALDGRIGVVGKVSFDVVYLASVECRASTTAGSSAHSVIYATTFVNRLRDYAGDMTESPLATPILHTGHYSGELILCANTILPFAYLDIVEFLDKITLEGWSAYLADRFKPTTKSAIYGTSTAAHPGWSVVVDYLMIATMFAQTTSAGA